MADATPTGRFTQHADDYAKYRPGYPPQLIDVLRARADFTPGQTIADIGCGTGISTMLLARSGFNVIGVEPNDAMRKHAAQAVLGQRVRLAAAPAEHTGLPDACVDHVTAFQAFHWFDRSAFKRECERVTRPGAFIVLVWNDRLADADPFAAGYEKLLQTHCPGYATVTMKAIRPTDLETFFEPSPMDRVTIGSDQPLDWDGLRGRFLSSSYVPLPGTPEHRPAMAALQALFDRTQSDGRVTMRYETQLYFGPVRPSPASVFSR